MCASKIIVALDVNPTELNALVNTLDPQLCRLKVGKSLFTRLGPALLHDLHAKGFEVFLDLKFHDIPQQIRGACQAAAELGVWMVNVHALGGKAMLQAARKAIDEFKGPKKPLLIGVTLLTSLDAKDLPNVGIQGNVEETVLRLATLCFEAGLDGVVCSAKEVSLIKSRISDKFLCVTPGIRLAQDETHDQIRIMTPQEALSMGSDYLVMGRSITHAVSPIKTLCQINESIGVAL